MKVSVCAYATVDEFRKNQGSEMATTDVGDHLYDAILNTAVRIYPQMPVIQVVDATFKQFLRLYKEGKVYRGVHIDSAVRVFKHLRPFASLFKGKGKTLTIFDGGNGRVEVAVDGKNVTGNLLGNGRLINIVSAIALEFGECISTVYVSIEDTLRQDAIIAITDSATKEGEMDLYICNRYNL